MQNAEVLVASHDKAFLEALQVTDKINVVRGSVGEPGHLRVTLAALACQKLHGCDDKLCLCMFTFTTTDFSGFLARSN